MDPSPQRIDFTYLEARDIVLATPRWHIATEADCEAWYHQWVAYLSGFGRKIDCVMVVDEFRVHPSVSGAWGRWRAKLVNEHVRHSCRVNQEWAVKIFTLTSGTRYHAATDEALSVEAAIQFIERARKAAPATSGEQGKPG